MGFKNMSKKKQIMIVVIIVMVILIAFRIISERMGDSGLTTSDVINIKVTTATLTTLENTSPLTGRLEPIEEVTIIPKIPGEVTDVYVSLGEKISKGTVLFELDKTQIGTSYNQAKVAYNDAKLNHDRMYTLYQEGAVSLQQYELSKTQYTIAKESYTAASDGLSNYIITSPIDGYVTSINVSIGTIASQTMPAATIANIEKLEIDTSVSETMINKIKIGDSVQVLVPSVSDNPLPGTITALSPAPATGSFTYPLKITLDSVSTLVKPGMFAEVIITSDKTENVLAIPSNAVLIKSGKTIVAIIEKDNKVSLKEVVVGLDNGNLAEIRSGIKVGDTVVVEGQYYLEETSEINIIE